MSASVPLRRASNYANPWWNPQVAGAVREARKAQRRWLQSRDLHDKQEAVRLSAARSKAVKEAKQASFRQFIDEEAQGDGLWKLARWSKGRSTTPGQVPSLQTSQGLASSQEDKVAALKAQFFPITETDLSDL
jgi:hypothetical protein